MHEKYRLALSCFVSSVLVSGCVQPTLDFIVGTPQARLMQVMPVLTPSNDATPEYTFNTDQAGIITYGGDCSSITSLAIPGNNTITFNNLTSGLHNNCTISVGISRPMLVTAFVIISARYLNDTGITLCGDYAYGFYSGQHSNDVNCMEAGASENFDGIDVSGDPVVAGQDAVYGRDANEETNSDSDGYKGFSFSKIGADGIVLAIQNGIWSNVGNEQDGTQWSCIKDNVTGLSWEVKTEDGGLHDKDWSYTWYSQDSIHNGGDAGTDNDEVDEVEGNCVDGIRCDTEKFVADVNAQGLCGGNNWRMPDTEELLSIVTKDRVSPVVDAIFFPNTISSGYWSSMPYAADSSLAWVVSFWNGIELAEAKSNSRHVRLVRNN